ncbi:MAG: InlB B-repeat-containing protein [Anaerocolumna sp.]
MNINKGRLIRIILSAILLTLSVPQRIDAATQNNESKTYIITFNARGGTVNTNSKSVTFGSTYGELPAVTRAHYEFKGWYTYAFGGVKISKDSTVKLPGPHFLYAHWTGKKYVVTLDANGGKVNKETVTVYYGTKYKNQLPDPTRENYVFDGWYTTAKGGDKITSGSVYDEFSKKKLYAHWLPKKLKIDLIAYNGESYEIEVTCGKKYGKLPKPVKEGYTFGGWYTWDNFTVYDSEAVTENQVAAVADPRILFARWY